MSFRNFCEVSRSGILTGFVEVEIESQHLSTSNSFYLCYLLFFQSQLEFHLFLIPIKNHFSFNKSAAKKSKSYISFGILLILLILILLLFYFNYYHINRPLSPVYAIFSPNLLNRLIMKHLIYDLISHVLSN